MTELFPTGIGIHHAGMLRSDRSLMERLFADGLLKVAAKPIHSPASLSHLPLQSCLFVHALTLLRAPTCMGVFLPRERLADGFYNRVAAFGDVG
jgi:hypothetical protein